MAPPSRPWIEASRQGKLVSVVCSVIAGWGDLDTVRWSRPRFTILTLMTLVVIAGLVLTVIVVRRERIARVIALKFANANFEKARLTREVAEIAVVEYTEGILKQDIKTVDDEIALARADVTNATGRSQPDEKAARAAKLKLESLTDHVRGTLWEDLIRGHSS
jgi:hypothetical protein